MAAAAVLAVALSVWLGGCADHRVDIQEFLAIQETTSTPAPTTQPAPDTEAVRTWINEQLGPYRVGPMDVLLVSLVGLEAPTPFLLAPVRVGEDGAIVLPNVGRIHVAGRNLSEVELAVRAAYVPAVLKDIGVHVELERAQETSVLLIGAVEVPRLVKLRRTERNLLHAIAKMEQVGVSETASGEVTLRRINRPEVVTLDLRHPEDIQTALRLDPLEDGDIVQLHAEQPNTIYVGGLVNFAHPQDYPRGTEVTVLQALAAARGPRTDVFPREATLIRRMPDQKDVHVRLDLERLRTGEDPNILLAAGDILWVPETWDTRVQDFINRNVFLRAGVSVNYNVSGVEFMNRQTTQTGNFGGTNLQDTFDPFGFLGRNTSLQTLSNRPLTP